MATDPRGVIFNDKVGYNAKQIFGVITILLFGFILFWSLRTDIMWETNMTTNVHILYNTFLLFVLCLMILTGVLLLAFNRFILITQFVCALGFFSSFLTILNPFFSRGTAIWLLILSILGIIWCGIFIILLVMNIQKEKKPKSSLVFQDKAQKSSSVSQDEAQNILRTRYAKGEITKEQYEQMKEDLNE
jgi:uncharacterized membrane protein